MPDEQGVWILDEDDLPLVWLSPLMVRRPGAMEEAHNLIRIYNGEEIAPKVRYTEEELRALRAKADEQRALAMAWLAEHKERLRAEREAEGNDKGNLLARLQKDPRFESDEQRLQYIENRKASHRIYLDGRTQPNPQGPN